MRLRLLVFGLLGLQTLAASAPQPVDRISPQVLGQLREEGLVRSQVMEHIATLSDATGRG